jgi:hypothetical protein
MGWDAMKDVTKTDLLRLSGRVVNAPAEAADGHVAVFDGSGGRALRDSGIGAAALWHAGNQGSGSELDADMVDGLHAQQLLTLDTSFKTIGSGEDLNDYLAVGNYACLSSAYAATLGNCPTDTAFRLFTMASLSQTYLLQLLITYQGDVFSRYQYSSGGELRLSGWRTYWSSRNDGPDSGLDADTVDGVHAGALMQADKVGSYYGMRTPEGSTSTWIRTTEAGFIPYQSGGGTSGLGTSYYPFRRMYLDISTTSSLNSLRRNNDTNQILYYSSSLRFKENVRTLEDEGIDPDVIYHIQPRIFDEKPDERKAQDIGNIIGFVAEEIEAAIPDIVFYDGDGHVQSYSEDAIVALLVGALGKLKKRVDELETRMGLKKAVACLPEPGMRMRSGPGLTVRVDRRDTDAWRRNEPGEKESGMDEML